MIHVITVGKKHEYWVAEGIERYAKRLAKPYTVSWELIAHSALSGHLAAQDESRRILERLKSDDFVILLDERGKIIDSPALSELLQDQFLAAQHIVIIIGGAYGVDETVQKRANFTWSLSKLVFPHQLVRLILTEQIYRAQSIQLGHPYHHD
ncbi:MAG: 23S rRNA (pseudouridine(1915)-N(3))-methyltransferase RlmH [Candidatus Saccharimonas sp.]